MMIPKVYRRLMRRFSGQTTDPSVSSSGALKKSVPQEAVENAAKSGKGNDKKSQEQGIGTAIRAGQAKLAYSKLKKWRARYLSARRNAVQLALSRLDREECTEEERQALRLLLEDTESDAATAALVTRSDGRSLQLTGVASFRQLLTLRSRRSQLVGAGPEWRLNSKEKGARFARRHGLACPDVYARNVKAEHLEILPGSVIKPASGAGSRGVYLILGDRRIFEPGRNREMQGDNALLESMREDLATKRVRYDCWTVEELVTEDEVGLKPGTDLKFYCFYGMVGLVLEVERTDSTRYCEWDGEGKLISTGKYVGKEFSGKGVSAEQLALAAELSLKIPSPFMRIDFIRSSTALEGMMFCEFTPRPGNYHRFNLETDRRLGDLYLMAEARLEKDMLQGKSFSRLFVE